MAEGYFLTVQQEQIYNEIRTKLSDATTKFIALTGSAGTGKTLLTYHIAKESIRKGEKVLILHCAPLNSGHKILMEEYGWSIHMPKYAPNTTDFDLIIIDEAQRMYPYQFDKYIEEVRTFNKKCIFSYDENQYLRDNEKNYHTKERIEKELSCTPYKLTDKIRTNKEIAYFIRQLFNLKKNISNIDYPNIELTYCKNYFSAKSLLQELSKKNWKVPNYTPGTRSTFHYEAYLSGDTECAHSVVGQKFDNVVIVIDDSFKYNSQGDLIADNTYYSQRQMLYQISTRLKNISVIGLHFHIGSQILDMDDFKALSNRINDLQCRLKQHGIVLPNINVGGGLGINYEHPDIEPIPDFAGYFSTYAKHLRILPDQKVHFELGRSVVGQCGTLITRLLYVKNGSYKKFAIVDAGMTDLIRPALYHAYHKIENISSNEEVETYDIVGPICESSDVFAKSIEINKCHRGDIIAIRSAGAYGEVMASQYNCRELPKGYITEEL